MGNILGEPFDKYVLDEINNRQKAYGSGYLDGTSRTPSQLQFLNNRNSWVKLASSVSISDKGISKLKDIGIETPEAGFIGVGLAKKAILFNGLSSFNTNSKNIFSDYTFRQGIINEESPISSFSTKNAYGLGGTDYGIQPMPGITSVNVESVNRGSIKKATVEIIAYNKFQFELIELLYLRLGYSMLVEYGWNSYLEGDKIVNIGNTLTEDFWFTPDTTSVLGILDKIEKLRGDYKANYDGFLGKVVNFKWTFNPNGTYNITLYLITMGDVIESLRINTSGTKPDPYADINNLDPEYADLKDSPILKGAPNSELGEWLYDIISWGVWEDNGKKYKYTSNFFRLNTTDPKLTSTPPNYRYYITLEQLLSKIQNDIIPYSVSSESNESILSIDLTPENYINVVNQQISLDPRICLFKPEKYNLTNLKEVFEPLEDFYIKDQTGFSKYGYLNKLYLNLDFISSILNKNTDEDGNLSIYKFIENICKGINKSLGGTCRLEPIIKKDKILTIIDQNPFPIQPKPAEKLFEIYGYNTIGESNFVKNISFTTKITPKMATQISIGATADGRSSKSIEGTAFQKWNTGLVDRFSEKIVEKTSTSKNKSTTPSKEEIRARESLGKFWDNWTYGVNTNSQGQVTKYLDKVPNLEGRVYMNLTKEQFISNALNDTLNNQREKNKQEVNTDIFKYSQSWGSYTNRALMGSHTPSNIPTYFNCDPKEIDIATQLFKDYLISNNNTRFVTKGESSNQTGFIPLEFQLDTEGISGVKIYQKLKINNKFFPPSYPKALNFLITGVNHKIENNTWTTSLSTLSTSNIEENKPYIVPIPLPPKPENTPEDTTPIIEETEIISSKNRFDPSRLSISFKGLEFIKKHESFRQYAYDDFQPNIIPLKSTTTIKGTLTIGYGFTKSVIPDLKFNSTITRVEADKLLKEKIQVYEKRVRRDVSKPLTQSEFDALVSIAYNAGEIGNTSAGKPTPLKTSLNQENYILAANTIPEYRITSKGIPNKGLIKRRKAEQDLFLS